MVHVIYAYNYLGIHMYIHTYVRNQVADLLGQVTCWVFFQSGFFVDLLISSGYVFPTTVCLCYRSTHRQSINTNDITKYLGMYFIITDPDWAIVLTKLNNKIARCIADCPAIPDDSALPTSGQWGPDPSLRAVIIIYYILSDRRSD